jgi:hypothetical protein
MILLSVCRRTYLEYDKGIAQTVRVYHEYLKIN